MVTIKKLELPIWMLAIGVMALMDTTEHFFSNPQDIQNTMLFFIGFLCIYTIPLQIVVLLDHKDNKRIALLNLVAGWTMMGWLIALIWALRK